MLKETEPGVRRCMRCEWLFVSPDRERIRRCRDCRDTEDGYSPRVSGTDDLRCLRGGHDVSSNY